jgi:hypothetical protein
VTLLGLAPLGDLGRRRTDRSSLLIASPPCALEPIGLVDTPAPPRAELGLSPVRCGSGIRDSVQLCSTGWHVRLSPHVSYGGINCTTIEDSDVSVSSAWPRLVADAVAAFRFAQVESRRCSCRWLRPFALFFSCEYRCHVTSSTGGCAQSTRTGGVGTELPMAGVPALHTCSGGLKTE